MGFLVQIGVDWIVAIQGLGAWLEMPMKFFSFLGTENFFFLILPLVYWCVDAGLGFRIGCILLTSHYFNSIFKLLFAGPRPYWVSDKVIPFAAESSFGIPSGHAQNAIGVWGVIAIVIRRPWAWVAAFVLAFFIGFSRWYLGVHFIHDVIVGWLLGGALLWAFNKFGDSVRASLRCKSLSSKILLFFIISLLFIALGAFSVGGMGGYTFPEAWKAHALRAGKLPAPVSIEGFITSTGMLFGLAVGAAWIAFRGGYQASGPVEKRALRYVLGFFGMAMLYRGLGLIFPDNADLVSYILRYIRYALVGCWVSAGAPWLFLRFKLADQQKF